MKQNKPKSFALPSCTRMGWGMHLYTMTSCKHVKYSKTASLRLTKIADDRTGLYGGVTTAQQQTVRPEETEDRDYIRVQQLRLLLKLRMWNLRLHAQQIQNNVCVCVFPGWWRVILVIEKFLIYITLPNGLAMVVIWFNFFGRLVMGPSNSTETNHTSGRRGHG